MCRSIPRPSAISSTSSTSTATTPSSRKPFGAWFQQGWGRFEAAPSLFSDSSDSRPLGRGSAERREEQLHRHFGGTPFALCHADQGTQQRYGGGCGGIE